MLPPALRHQRFRILWLGLLISIAGTRMQAAAILWHVNELTNLPIALGAVGLANIAPVLVLSLLAGAAADAINRRNLLFLTQTSLALLAALLAWLTMRGAVSLWAIYAVSALSAGVATFDLPARQALVPNLVPRDLLPNAFSLNAIAYQFGSIVGPALGGLVLARLGIAYTYWINAVSYLAVIVALVLMGPVPQGTASTPGGAPNGNHVPLGSLASAVSEGVRFVIGQPIIFSSMMLDFLATFFSSATALLPIFARSILNVGALGYGWLVAAPSVGAGAVAAVLSFSRTIRRQGPVLIGAVAVFGVATAAFGVSKVFWLTFLALVIVGASDGVSTIIRNTIRQLQTPDRLRGRMTSVNQIFFMGGPQLGELEAGAVAQWFGAPLSVVSGGVGCLVALAALAARYPQLRRYRGDEPTSVETVAAPSAAQH
jgi:MFS family permease